MKHSRSLSLGLALVWAISALAQVPPPLREPRKKKKNEDKEPITQTLPLLKDPPATASADTARLVFHASPLSDKGLLSQQTRDALNALMKLNRGAQIVKLRAFVAGTGDLRRVQTIVSEVFTDKKQPIPALSTIQAGALPMEGAQVVMEAVSADKSPRNPNGIVFFSGQSAADVSAALGQIESAAKTAGVSNPDMLRLTCFLSALDRVQGAREAATRRFPGAAAVFVQALRAGPEAGAVCEGAGRRTAATGSSSPAAAIVTAPKIVFSGMQMAFGGQDADLRLAFERLDKAIEAAGVSYRDVVFASFHPLTRAVEARSRAIQGEVLRDAHPAQTTVLVEGLPSLDATMALEVVAAK